ncbi:hypothetical protein G6M78_10425 [Agrobacterium tumefaciens]|uniref:Uncharacterized protein n=1 Tax=Agrobacterium tumefaciens TaxID=358 RepID=A0A546Y7V6_AGRTU|nr:MULTISPECIES: hypothetical protein [Agrobacterium]MBO0128354.1 hypothetical protein [Agrobacterium sp. OT33]NTE55488.1 hypothetical protein [Agrobacterium tumefaciens]NTE70848.1 hypothetical protein [Agrobacterium tumefaciens]TRB09088.1 hypothetical protein EXN61_04135 [Agrobacterium tumefaciens]
MFDFTHHNLHIEYDAPESGSAVAGIGRRRFAAFVCREYGRISSFSKDRRLAIDRPLFVDNALRRGRRGLDFDQGEGRRGREIWV